MTSPTPNWVNVKDNGAVGDGVTDDTAAIQAVLTAAESVPGGTVVYLPAGLYLVSALSYSSAAPLVIRGDGTGNYNASQPPVGLSWLVSSTSAPGTHVLEIDTAASCLLEDFGILAAMTGPSSPTVDYIGVNFSGVNYVHMSRTTIFQQTGGGFVNTCIKTDAGVKNFMLDDFVGGANLYGYWMSGGIQSSLRNANIGTTSGDGGAAIHMDNGSGTIRLTNVQTDRGDRGFWMRANGGAAPAFVFMNDVEFNNYEVSGIQLDDGSQVWVNQAWCSGAGSTPQNAVATSTTFAGVAYFHQCTFQQCLGHTVLLQNGTGYGFSDCIFGTWNKSAADAYDELHIGGNVHDVTVTGCHFNVDPHYGVGSPAPRSAVWIGTGANNIGVCNCICASSGYGAGQGQGGNLGIGVWTGNLGVWT